MCSANNERFDCGTTLNLVCFLVFGFGFRFGFGFVAWAAGQIVGTAFGMQSLTDRVGEREGDGGERERQADKQKL